MRASHSNSACLCEEARQAYEELARTQEQFVQAQKMEAIGRLAGGVAHDFNNLLTVILGRSQILLQRLADDDPSRRHVKLIAKAGERAEALTHQLLAFSRKQVLQPKVVDLNAVLAGAEKILRRLIGEDVELVMVGDPELGRVKADPCQLEQVIMNLAVNARDAMPRGGRLVFKTANVELDRPVLRQQGEIPPGAYVALEVGDTGCGMDEATQARIFEPFFTTKGPGKGTGLGLATVFGIVHQSGGHIWLYSEPGYGTLFKIYLPRVDAPLEAERSVPPSAAVEPGSGTVLLVEDADELRDLVTEMLEAHGYTALRAANGEEALRVAAEHAGPIDLLVTDVIMPQMSGREVAERLAASRPETPVLYMSGYTDETIGHHGLLEPGIALLPKPFTESTLVRRIRDLLDAGRAGGPVETGGATMPDKRLEDLLALVEAWRARVMERERARTRTLAEGSGGADTRGEAPAEPGAARQPEPVGGASR